jgi:hypothetical protein
MKAKYQAMWRLLAKKGAKNNIAKRVWRGGCRCGKRGDAQRRRHLEKRKKMAGGRRRRK